METREWRMPPDGCCCLPFSDICRQPKQTEDDLAGQQGREISMKMTWKSFCVAGMLASIVVGGCQGASSPPPTTQTVTSPTLVLATKPLPPSTPSPVPPAKPSATLPSPVPPAEPSATFPAEIIATKPEEVAGVWLLHWVGQGGLVRFRADLTFRADSTFSMDDKDDGMHIFAGVLRFGDGKVQLDSDECYNEVKALFYHCTMTFTIYSTIQDGKPVRIRMVSAGDKGVFVTNVNNKMLFLDRP